MLEHHIQKVMEEAVLKDVNTAIQKELKNINIDKETTKAVQRWMKSDDFQDLVNEVISEDCWEIVYRPIRQHVQQFLKKKFK